MATTTAKFSNDEGDAKRAKLIFRLEDGGLRTTEVFDTFLNDMYGHLRSTENERLLTILTSAYFELFTNTLIQHHCRNAKRILKDTRTYPWSAKKIILAELGVIDEDQLKLLDWFRGLRNRAAHKEQFEITQTDVDKYPFKDGVGRFAFAYHSFQAGAGFRSVCMELIGLWLGADDVLLHLVLRESDETQEKKHAT